MTEAEIMSQLFSVFRTLRPDSNADLSSVSMNTRLRDDLGLDSINMLYIVISSEEIFDITFENVNFGDFVTVGDVVCYIKRKMKNGGNFS